jgi:hypothetical protein
VGPAWDSASPLREFFTPLQPALTRHNQTPRVVTAPPLTPPPRPTSRRIAVFGSIAAERPPSELEPGLPGPVPSPATRAVLEHVFAAIAAQTREIAQPILDRAMADGALTRGEHDELLRELGEPSVAAPAAVAVRPVAREVLREALAAIRAASPGIAAPILREAVASERLTAAQEQRILERLRRSPTTAALRTTARLDTES